MNDRLAEPNIQHTNEVIPYLHNNLKNQNGFFHEAMKNINKKERKLDLPLVN